MKKLYGKSLLSSLNNNLIIGFILIFAFSWIKPAWPLVYVFLLLAILQGGVEYGYLCALSAVIGAGVNYLWFLGGTSYDFASHLILVSISLALGLMFVEREDEEDSEFDFSPGSEVIPSLSFTGVKDEEVFPEREDVSFEIRQKRIQLKLSLDVSQRLDELLDFVNNYLAPYSVVLFMYDASVNFLKINKYRTGSDRFNRDALISVGQGLVGWIGRIQKTLHVKDISKHSGSLLYYQGDQSVSSFLGIPFFSGERLAGVLSVDSVNPNNFNEADEKLLEWCGKQVVNILLGADEKRMFLRQVTEISLLYNASQELNSSLNEEDILNSLVRTASEIVGREKAAFLNWVENKGELKVEADVGFTPTLVNHTEKVTKTNILSWIINHKQPLRIHNIQDRLINNETERNPLYLKKHSCLGLPLMLGERLRGILILVSKQRRRFTQVDQETLIILSNLAAFALSKAEIYNQMREMAISDGLTSLYNHQYFEKKLIQEMARARRYQKNLSLILLDIDHFKKINDSFGHLVGDEVLRMLGNILKEEMRDIDIASRYGGEEFAIILPETGIDNAKLVADRLRVKVFEIFKKSANVKETITISLGVGTFPVHGEREEDLIGNVDAALYEAKNQGRNRTVACAKLTTKVYDDN